MNDRETNSLMMFKGVDNNFTEHRQIVSTVPALEKLSVKLHGKVLDIEKLAMQHDSITVGKTDVKLNAREALLDQIRVKSAVLYSYSKSIGDLETLAMTRTPDYRVRMQRDEEVIRSAELLYEALVKAGDALADYGVPEAGVLEFRAALDAFRRALGTRDHSKSSRSVSRSTLTALFASVRELLTEEVDPIMELFRTSHPVFYDTYRALRVTKALATRHRKDNGQSPEGTPVPDTTAPAAADPAAPSVN